MTLTIDLLTQNSTAIKYLIKNIIKLYEVSTSAIKHIQLYNSHLLRSKWLWPLTYWHQMHQWTSPDLEQSSCEVWRVWVKRNSSYHNIDDFYILGHSDLNLWPTDQKNKSDFFLILTNHSMKFEECG